MTNSDGKATCNDSLQVADTSLREKERDKLFANDTVWARFYRDGHNLGQIASEFECSIYDLSPWLTAPLTRAVMDDAPAKDRRIEALEAALRAYGSLSADLASNGDWSSGTVRMTPSQGSEVAKAVALGASVLARIEDRAAREIAIRNALTAASAAPQPPAEGGWMPPEGWKANTTKWRKYPLVIRFSDQYAEWFVEVHHKEAGVSSVMAAFSSAEKAFEYAETVKLPDYAASPLPPAPANGGDTHGK